MTETFKSSLHLGRHSFSPRDVARASAVWRACQDVAVDASAAGGWPPSRYREMQTAFVVREMTVVHHRESTYGETMQATSWVSRLRRQLLSTRQIRLDTHNASGTGFWRVAAATQEWVHVSNELKPQRGSPELNDAFPILTLEESVSMPSFEALAAPNPAPVHRFAFRTWQTWMDPLGHINHPMYIDWIDEAIALVVTAAGFVEHRIRPLAETGTFRVGVGAGVTVEVETQLLGMTTDRAAVLQHRIVGEGGVLYAELTSVRELVEGPPGALANLFR